MGIFDILLGRDIMVSKNCFLESYQTDSKVGKWVYNCKVKCPKSSVNQIVRCFVEDIETKPTYKCSCGEVFEFFQHLTKYTWVKTKVSFTTLELCSD